VYMFISDFAQAMCELGVYINSVDLLSMKKRAIRLRITIASAHFSLARTKVLISSAAGTLTFCFNYFDFHAYVTDFSSKNVIYKSESHKFQVIY